MNSMNSLNAFQSTTFQYNNSSVKKKNFFFKINKKISNLLMQNLKEHYFSDFGFVLLQTELKVIWLWIFLEKFWSWLTTEHETTQINFSYSVNISELWKIVLHAKNDKKLYPKYNGIIQTIKFVSIFNWYGFLKSLMAKNDFYNEIIEIFCEKTKRVELLYK